MDKLKVSSKTMRDTSDSYKTSGDKIKNYTDKMTAMASSLQSAWTGDAANDFIKKIKDLNQDITKINTKIKNHSKNMKEMATEYEKQEKANISLAASLKPNVIN